MRQLALLVCVGILALVPEAVSRSWYIEPDGTGDAPTIQAGIDSASAGDEVVLADGVYTGDGNRDIDYNAMAITVRSASADPELCIIDCQGSIGAPHRGFGFEPGTGPNSVLSGVTIRNGYWDAGGGGIGCWQASPTITDVILHDNHAYRGGGGIECGTQSSPTIANVEFRNNSTDGSVGGGGGLWCRYAAKPVVTNAVFIGNVNLDEHGSGGAIFCLKASAFFIDCIVAYNRAAGSGGGAECRECAPSFRNVTFCGNSAPNGSGICVRHPDWDPILENVIIAYGEMGGSAYAYGGGGLVLGCCNIYRNEGGDWPGIIADQLGINGNFSACPSFCHAGSGDFRLCDQSPCAPGNHPDGYDCGLVGAWDVGCSCGPTAVKPTTWGAIKSTYR